MRRPARLVMLLALVAATCMSLLAASATARPSAAIPPAPRLQTALWDPAATNGPNPGQAYERIKQTGATAVRLLLNWLVAAPQTRAPGFAAANPDDPGYNWAAFDAEVRGAVAHGLDPIVNIQDAPEWAVARQMRGGPYKPDLKQLAAFGRAAALRYSGQHSDLPRVRYWMLWNEPNLAIDLRPQLIGKKPYSAYWYRQMVNAFAKAVKTVDPTNLVVAGATAPFTSRAGKPTSWGPGPLLFMREFLCLSKTLKPTCSQRVNFDIWSHHPYTSGGPTHHANGREDVSLGDLPQMSRVLGAGVATGHIVSKHDVEFWVTEFSWDTNPPDPNAVPMALHTRWVSEALYRANQAGVSLFTWFSIIDQPLTVPYQAGMFFVDGQPKPSLQAFRFPFVAFRSKEGVVVWGRTPSGKRADVIVEQRSGGNWRRVAKLRASPTGIFGATVKVQAVTPLRARLATGSDASVEFSLKEPPDAVYRPFGEAK